MTLTKIVDGKEIHLSPQEEEQVLIQWEKESSYPKIPFYVKERRKMYLEEDWLDLLWHDIDNNKLNKNGNFYINRLTIKNQIPKDLKEG